MDLTKLPSSVVAQLVGAVESFILASRKKYASMAAPLQTERMRPLQPYFPADILRNARFLVLDGQRIDDPPFYSMAKMMGIRNLPSFSDVAAVTFVDVVVSHEEFTESLLFHELVHVVQYAQMGTRDFASRYVNGFIKGGSYEEIPLEKNAYELEQKFNSDKSPFLVADEVRRWIDAGKF
jgi:hypothetical protein